MSPSIKKIYIKNRELNKEKIGFFTFLMNSSKAEMLFDRFQKILFWNSIYDIFLFFYAFVYFVLMQVNFGLIFFSLGMLLGEL